MAYFVQQKLCFPKAWCLMKVLPLFTSPRDLEQAYTKSAHAQRPTVQSLITAFTLMSSFITTLHLYMFVSFSGFRTIQRFEYQSVLIQPPPLVFQ